MAGQVIAFETTKVPADKTAMEIEDLLRKHHASKVAKEYAAGTILALYFEMMTPQGPVSFKLPVNVDAVYQVVLNKRAESPVYAHRFPDHDQKLKVHAQAERIAWRIIREWVKAQLDLIQTQMVTVVEVFMPYLLVGHGETAYERFMAPAEDGGFRG